MTCPDAAQARVPITHSLQRTVGDAIRTAAQPVHCSVLTAASQQTVQDEIEHVQH